MEVTEKGETRSLPVIAGISREIVRVHATHYGRGPTKAKTIWRDDIVVCVLEDIFTKSEAVLVSVGKFDQVRSNRQAFQDAVEPLLSKVVEEATGVPVRSFLSQVSADGVASEVRTGQRRNGRRRTRRSRSRWPASTSRRTASEPQREGRDGRRRAGLGADGHRLLPR